MKPSPSTEPGSNPKILQSLNDLGELAKSVVLPCKSPDQFELDLIKKGWFYCLNDKTYSAEFPEEACFADFEWLVKQDGAVFLSDELPEVTIKKPFCGQFIGISGKTYLWFQPGDYGTGLLTLCKVGARLRTIVVHNIAADRPMIAESATLNTNYGPNFFCTMSAHLLCAGVSDQQSWYYQGKESNRAGGLKNLIDVFNFWSEASYPEVLSLSAKRGSATQQEKKIRNMFLDGNLKAIKTCLPALINYGLQDVIKTQRIFTNLYPAWLDTLPSRESQYFYLKRAKINYSLPQYYKEWFFSTESLYQTIKQEIKALVKANNEEKIKEFKQEFERVYNRKEPYVVDGKYLKKDGSFNKKYNEVISASESEPSCLEIIKKWSAKYPAVSWAIDSDMTPLWYKSCEHSADSPICQLLLDPCFLYEGKLCPVSYDKLLKFVFKTESGAIYKITSPKKGSLTKDNCGSILAKDFIDLWETNVLRTNSEITKKIVNKMSLISYWTSIRSRLAELVVHDSR